MTKIPKEDDESHLFCLKQYLLKIIINCHITIELIENIIYTMYDIIIGRRNKMRPIGIFDSGIGGVTVFKEIKKLLPNEAYIYYSDSKNNPYGDKSNDEIIDICDKITKYFINRDCKAVVIACNTASAEAVDYLRKKYNDIDFIAIEPAYKMVYDYSYNEPTLVMATKGTIQSEKFNILYNKYNNNNTELLSCIGLADIIEEGDEEKIKRYLQENLSRYKGKIKNIVLRMYTLSFN